jgi:hypothetical protein
MRSVADSSLGHVSRRPPSNAGKTASGPGREHEFAAFMPLLHKEVLRDLFGVATDAALDMPREELGCGKGLVFQGQSVQKRLHEIGVFASTAVRHRLVGIAGQRIAGLAQAHLVEELDPAQLAKLIDLSPR